MHQKILSKLKDFEPLFIFLTLIATVIGLSFVIIQIRDARDSTNQLLRSANDNTILQLMYSLNQQLLTTPNSQILYAIEQNKPIRKNFSDLELDDYLSVYEALGVLYAQNQKTSFSDEGTPTHFLCDTFYDPTIDSLNNSEIQTFIKQRRASFSAYQGYLDNLKQAVNNKDSVQMCPKFN